MELRLNTSQGIVQTAWKNLEWEVAITLSNSHPVFFALLDYD